MLVKELEVLTVFNGKKNRENNNSDGNMVKNFEDASQEILILVSEEDKTGSDVMQMSDFFSLALHGMSKELVKSEVGISINELPVADLNIINDAIKTVGVFRSHEFDLIPDYASLPKDIRDKFNTGELALGESRQVEGNIRAVLVDAETKNRVKDVTFKKVENTDATAEITRDMLNQMQLKQISAKLDYMISEQSYMIDFVRNQAIIRPFLDARDNILKAQEQITYSEQRVYLLKAADSLQSAINAVYVDMNTIEGHLAEEVNKKWFQRLNRNNIDKQISRLMDDTMVVTKYVGMQMLVYHYLGDRSSSRNVIDTYRGNINRFFEKGIVSSDKSLALFIHENVNYNENNMDCWYYMENRMKPLLDSAYDRIESKTVYVISGGEEYEC